MDDLLRAAPLFAGLDDAAWTALRPRLTERRLDRGEHLFAEGDPGDALHVVAEGKVKICRTAHDGRENVIAVLGPGDLLGELSIFDAQPRAASAVAVTDCAFATLSGHDFAGWLADCPAVALDLLRALATRLRQTNEAMADLVFTDVPGRIAKTLLSLAVKFGEPDGTGGVRVAHDLTQEELAQLVGASRETVNKALAEFATRGWIRLDGRAVVLLDADRLERRAH
ncbi:MAG: family transcriptional regulator, cyclic receptor protein [Frankiaceae bacterium]|jgi:CRP-like cAMP-binding protein|nr:family transcriptional regulator, cyclic receptor protein [Frankiaceae bacterium]